MIHSKDAKNLFNYKQLNGYEKLVLRTCFNIPKPNYSVGAKSIDAYIEECTFHFSKYLGQDFIKGLENKRILDLGCGKGYYALTMAKLCPSAQVVGVDLYPHFKENEMLAKAQGLSNLSFCTKDQATFSANSFDIVLSWNSFEHFEEPKTILNEMKTWCKRGGNIFVKFGPTWMGPYGRHMTSTFRKDRPWFHLFLGEKTVMRVYSVVKGFSELKSTWAEFPDGLNKMTVKKAHKLLHNVRGTAVQRFEVTYYDRYNKLSVFKKMPLIKELFSDAVTCQLSVIE